MKIMDWLLGTAAKPTTAETIPGIWAYECQQAALAHLRRRVIEMNPPNLEQVLTEVDQICAGQIITDDSKVIQPEAN